MTAQWLAGRPEFDALYCNFITFDEAGTHPDKFSLAPAGFFENAQRSGDFWHAIPDLYARTVGFPAAVSFGLRCAQIVLYGIGGFDYALTTLAAKTGNLRWVLAKGQSRYAPNRLYESENTAETIQPIQCARCAAPPISWNSHCRPRERRGTYQDIILRSIDERRAGVFDAAFARGAFDTAEDMLAQLRRTPRDPKFVIKVLITKLPKSLRSRLWGMTQAT